MARPDMFCRSELTGSPFVDAFPMLEPHEVESILEQCPENCPVDTERFERLQATVEEAKAFEGTACDWLRQDSQTGCSRTLGNWRCSP